MSCLKPFVLSFDVLTSVHNSPLDTNSFILLLLKSEPPIFRQFQTGLCEMDKTTILHKLKWVQSHSNKFYVTMYTYLTMYLTCLHLNLIIYLTCVHLYLTMYTYKTVVPILQLAVP